MSNRERVLRAIEAPVEEAAKLLAELTDADAHTRLTIALDGWGRGLAAGLEELAVAVDELRRSTGEDVRGGESITAIDRHVKPDSEAEEESEVPDEEELRERAAALQEHVESVRRETEAASAQERDRG
jgi:hypothetical protein